MGAIGANCVCQREIRKSSVLISAKPPDQVFQQEWTATSSVVARSVQACELCLCICNFCGILRKIATSILRLRMQGRIPTSSNFCGSGRLARAHAGKRTAVIKIAEIF